MRVSSQPFLSRPVSDRIAQEEYPMKNELGIEEREQLQRLEEDLWREQTRFDIAYMEQVIAGDFFEFGRSGQLLGHTGLPSFVGDIGGKEPYIPESRDEADI
jgi:hypothetical protein